MGAAEASRKALVARTRRGDFDAAYALAFGYGFTRVEQVLDAVFPLAREGGEPVPFAVFDVITDALHQARLDTYRDRETRPQEVKAT